MDLAPRRRMKELYDGSAIEFPPSPNPPEQQAPPMNMDKRITPARPDLAAEELRGVVEAERFSPGKARRVVAPVAPVRRHPQPDAPLDTEALMGEPVTVYDENEGWAWGQLGFDGYVGYLPAEALAEQAAEPDHRVRVLRTFVYPGPNLKLPPTAHLSLGSLVTVTGIDGDFASLASGGFVFAAHLSAQDEVDTDFVAVAERLVGTPYLWGGKSTLGLDCSGLVQLSLAACGIRAPRDTDMQEAGLGASLPLSPDLSGLRRGDLVFWKGHVGLMLDSERLLHANGHHMLTAAEPLREAEERIRLKSFGPITSVRRLADVAP
jgi:cell wall-associated NlpC family hydrolase